MIIAISGKSGSGKDTLGKAFIELSRGKQYIVGLGWVQTSPFSSSAIIKKFADKLKLSIESKFPKQFSRASWEYQGEPYRNEFIPQWGMTRREFVIAEGMALRAVYPNYWVDALLSDYTPLERRQTSTESLSSQYLPTWIITDLRFDNEYEEISKLGGIIVKVERDETEDSDDVSEKSLSKDSFFSYVFDNNYDKENLIFQAQDFWNNNKLNKY